VASAPLCIPARFNGPPGTGNGGYTCGRLAALLEAPVAAVTLRSPPPLETDMEADVSADRVELRAGGTLVAEAEPTEVALEPPPNPGVDRAEQAARAQAEAWARGHPFPTCVVCGPERAPGDGFGMYPGALGHDDLYACVWEPQDGDARPECAWAALDCPTSAPVGNPGWEPPIVLARMAARLDRPPVAGHKHVVVSWPLALEGRKRRAGAALYGPDGRLSAVAEALWIELRDS